MEADGEAEKSEGITIVCVLNIKSGIMDSAQSLLPSLPSVWLRRSHYP